ELPTEAPQSLATPGEPGRYAILRRLGSGGMGVVYKVYDHKMERLVAVKRLNPQREKRGGILRFFTEAKAIARLNHPNIVSIFDIVEDRRGFFIVMELVRGLSVRMWVKRHGPLPKSLGVQILRQVAEALCYAHRQNIIHRDVKPGNILIGKGYVPKIVDFGVAVIGDTGPSKANPRRIAGTRGYIAPEARWSQGKVDPRADVYSFGMTVLEAFAGIKPWMVREYPDFIADFILQATRENPKDRFQSMEELLKCWDDIENACKTPEDPVPESVRNLILPPKPRHDVLEIRGGDRDGEAVTLIEPITLIGRSHLRCNLPIDDPQISRVHIKIVREEGEAFVFDMGSHNGTFVGNQQVKAVRLTEGMEIRIGGTQLRYL
ncbi:MAG: protein kinase domain-containing protein, partial [Planctomycetota bacterium]